MIAPHIANQLCESIESVMIPADNVANVISTHTLENGLLVLSSVKYSMIPVLTPDSHLEGIISMARIIQAAMTNAQIDLSVLRDMKVRDIELGKPACVTLESSLEDVLRLLVDANFVCVVESKANPYFLGIITRRTMLSRLIHFVHEVGH